MPAPPDDTRHALLSKAHAVAQTDLAAFATSGAPLLPRSDYGAFGVQEVEVRSALTVCNIGDRPWSLNPYMGCSHACVYCYVPAVAHLERERWGSYVVVKRNLPTVLARELKTHERRDVFLSSATDPYQPAEKVYRITRRCLELLVRSGWPVSVLTRNPLAARDIDLFGEIDDLSIGMSIPTLDDRARRVLEPGAPSIQSRLRTIRVFADAGLEPYVNLAPAYPFTGDVTPRDIAAAFKDAGVAGVRAGAWGYLDGVLPALHGRVAGTLYGGFEQAVTQSDYYDRMFRAIGAACRREGVKFRLMTRGDRDRPSPPGGETKAGGQVQRSLDALRDTFTA